MGDGLVVPVWSACGLVLGGVIERRVHLGAQDCTRRPGERGGDGLVARRPEPFHRQQWLTVPLPATRARSTLRVTNRELHLDVLSSQRPRAFNRPENKARVLETLRWAPTANMGTR